MPKPACTFTAACKAGVALNLATPLTALDWVLNEADLVLLLATNPGFSGQKHLPATAAKTARLCEMLVSAGSAAVIMVDGGIKRKILPGLVEAGARAFVAGNAVFKHPEGIAAGIRSLCDF